MKRGEVWWHEPPDEKPRPVVVLTREAHLTQRITELDAAKMDAVCRAPGDGNELRLSLDH